MHPKNKIVMLYAVLVYTNSSRVFVNIHSKCIHTLSVRTMVRFHP